MEDGKIFELDRSICGYLKAVSILFVIVGHIFGGVFDLLSVETTAALGTGAVNMFLILSGYGLYVSYCTKGIGGKAYWNKKVSGIFVPYGLVTIVYFLYLRIRGSTLSVYVLLQNMLCVDFSRSMDGTMWYMSFLLIWYLLFFATFYFDFPKLFKVGLLFAFGNVFHNNVFSLVFDGCSWQFMTNAYAFPIGVAIGYAFDIANKLAELKISRSQKRTGGYIMALASGVLGICGLLGYVEMSYWQYGLCYLVFFYRLFRLLGRDLRILGWIGQNSFILYLIEGKLLAVLGVLELFQQNVMIYVCVYTIVIVALVQFYNFCYSKFIGLLRKCDL